MTPNNNEIKILGKYCLDEIYISSPEDSEQEGFFVKETDEQVFPILWDEVFPFSSDGYAAVRKGNLWGVINVMGELIIPYKWKDVRLSQVTFPEGLCAVQDNYDLWGFINTKGEVVLPCQWKECRDFRNGECAVKDDKNQWSYIDKKGNFIHVSKWKEIGEWDEENGLLSVQDENGLWGFADKDDCLLIPCQWKETHLFEKTEETAGIQYVCWVMNQEGLWGCIDKRGEVVIAYSWTDCCYFSEGLCGVKGDNGRWGAIDVHGNLVVPTKWDNEPLFLNGEAIVFKNGNPYKIDRSGKVVKDSGNVFDRAGSTKYKVWGLLAAVVILGIGVYALADKIGYVDYNPIRAYSLFSQQWTGWLVALIGGLHTYELLLPLGLVASYLYIRFSSKDVFAEWETHGGLKQKAVRHETDEGDAEQSLIKKWTTKLFGNNSSGMSSLLVLLLFVFLGGIWSHIYIILAMVIAFFPVGLQCWLWKSTGMKITFDRYFSSFDASVVILFMLLPLRVIYFVLFFVNYQTANTTETKVMHIMSADYESHRSSKSYYFYIEVDNGMPYELKVSKDAYKNFKEGKTSKVLAEVRTGKLGFSYVGNFKTQRVVQAENEIERINQGLSNTLAEYKYINYRGKTTHLRVCIETGYQDIPNLQRAASKTLFGEDCNSVLTAYQHFREKYPSLTLPKEPDSNDCPFLSISFSRKAFFTAHPSFTLIDAEMLYSEKAGVFEYLCNKHFTIDLQNHRLLTIDDVLSPSGMKTLKEVAKEAEVFLYVCENRIKFRWYEGNNEKEYQIDYDDSEKFTADFRELLESVKK